MGQFSVTILAVAGSILSGNQHRKITDRKIVHDAMKAIEERNATAMAMAGLLVNEWDEARIANEERDMFLGAFTKVAPLPIAGGNGLGHSILASAAARSTDTAKLTPANRRKTNVSFEE